MQKQEKTTLKAQPQVFTPSMVSKIYTKAVRISLENTPALVSGLFYSTGRKPYNGYYYDSIRDEVTGEHLVTKTPESIRVKLENGSLYTFKGMIETQPSNRENIGFQILFTPLEILNVEKPAVDERTETMIALFRKKALERNVDVDKILLRKLLSGEKPRIGMIFGKEGIVDQDVITALSDVQTVYDIREIRVNLSDKSQIIAALQKSEALYDVICVVRGGGSSASLEIFDDLDICKVLIGLRGVATISAIGHSADKTLYRQLSDKSCTTPTALGTYLRDIYREVEKNKLEGKVGSVAPQVAQENKVKYFFYGAATTAALVTGYLLFF